MRFERLAGFFPWVVLLTSVLIGLIYLPEMVGIQEEGPRIQRDSEIISARIWYTVTSNNSELEAWKAKWSPVMELCDVVGGCSCCFEEYALRGPRVAIDSFPREDNDR